MFDRNGHLLAPEHQQQASSSRSPSPHGRIPVVSSPRQMDIPLAPAARAMGLPGRSRTPSPDRHALPHPPKVPSSPSRAASPLGKPTRGPRPLPNPFSRSTGSQQSLAGNHPSRSGTGSSAHHASSSANHADDEDASVLDKPSRKALGKRRAVADEDSQSFFFTTDSG